MNMNNLRKKPFNLSDHDIQWVEDTLAGMDLETKVGQLFCLVVPTNDVESIDQMLQMIKPVMVNMLGPLGQNLHFILFPAKTSAGKRIAAAKEKGTFKIKLGSKNFKWRLPLDSLLPVKVCSGCKEECKGSWSFCPWCGKGLTAR